MHLFRCRLISGHSNFLGNVRGISAVRADAFARKSHVAIDGKDANLAAQSGEWDRMNFRALAILVGSLALCGCSGEVWDKTASVADYFGFNDDDEAAPPDTPGAGEAPAALPTAPPQADRSETFCKGVADTERWKSEQFGSTPDVQQKNAGNAYRQCMDGSSHWVD